MSEKPASMQVDTLERASKMVTHCAVVLPLALGYVKATTGLPSVAWGLGLAGWILLALIAGMLRCTVYVCRRIDDREARLVKQVKCLKDQVSAAMSDESRTVRAAAIVAALDDNVTSINHNTRR